MVEERISAEDLEVVAEKVPEAMASAVVNPPHLNHLNEEEDRHPLCEDEDYFEIEKINASAKVPKLARFKGQGRSDIWLSRGARLLTQAGVAKSRWSVRMGLAMVGEPQRWYTALVKQISEQGDRIPWPIFKQAFLTKYPVDSYEASSRRAIRALGFISVDQLIIELRICRKAAPRGKYTESDWIGFFYEQLPSRFYDYILLLESEGIGSLNEVEELVKQYDRKLQAEATPRLRSGK